MANDQAGASTAPVLITGAAGFIGFSLARRLLESGRPVVGVDNINAYYDPALKEARLTVLSRFPDFQFQRLDLADRKTAAALFGSGNFGPVVHLAAQAGVRHSLMQPHDYADANIVGFLNVLEGCRGRGTSHLIYASSSSVYGANAKLPFSEHDGADHPLSLYGATKKANELMAHAYSHLFALPATGLRFFTVYGPWGRPDMAIFIFAKAIMTGQPIRLFNNGRMRRDFTYIDDVTEAIARLIAAPPVPRMTTDLAVSDPATSTAPWRVYNIGNHRPVEVPRVVDLLEKELGREARRELLPMQRGDVPETSADIDDLKRDVGFQPSTTIEEGIRRFAKWFLDFYR